ncbi:regulatory protein, MarR [Magnetococcus marinus MC-1]|uniref:Regulatory protein, MarR n=1 Tax=Magnetococcus marinus (strain ATCC BAA-1437 / JCM 17883 / MC-1) TaxID=156889 RepID=A0LCU8_MAGMM|nr:MarR family transcriptional regulator [Magnetococcus marinus]ABK45791.1 regulatory protein, MarR [Magnetococcus marinus MC-1]
MNFDFNHVDPAWVAEVPELSEILQSIEATDPLALSGPLAETLDYVYRVRFARLLMGHPATEDMEALALHMESVAVVPRRAKQLSATHKDRWQMLRDVLEDRMAVRALSIPKAVKTRPHVLPILRLIRDTGGMTQQALQEQLALQPANLSRILTMLEGWELVVRNRVGKQNWLSLGPRAGEMLQPAQAPATQATTSSTPVTNNILPFNRDPKATKNEPWRPKGWELASA